MSYHAFPLLLQSVTLVGCKARHPLQQYDPYTRLFLQPCCVCVFAGDVQVTYEEHSKFEEEIVFPHFNFVFPGIADQVGAYRSTCFFACCKWKVVYL